jgi:peptidoglycan/xylan/chitin deacetylase (PgdA/CDA1 family)/GT2 family glycosyltransferase
VSARERLVARRRQWLLVVVGSGVAAAILLCNGLVTSEIGVDGRGAGIDGPDGRVPVAVSEGGPVVDLTHGRSRTLAMPAGTVALTFDDGPDPAWTPQVLAVLARYQVPATFFVVGSRVASRPDLARAIRATGSEIGLHTFTHPDLGEVSEARVDRELTATQLALAGATGELSYLVRPPYSSEPSALDDTRFELIRRLGQQGYVTALVDTDSDDWQRPGALAIARSLEAAGDTGGVVLLHDAGGDRSQTVAALEAALPRMLRSGVTFTTVTGGASLPAASTSAGWSERVAGDVMLAAVVAAAAAVTALAWSMWGVGAIAIARLLVMVVVAAGHGRRRRAPAFRWGKAFDDPVSVVVPAFNEKETIEATVRSLVNGVHPVEVVVVDDGSTDGTADIVEGLGLAGVRVVRQENRGKPAALNTGVAAAAHDVVVMMDGDTVFEPTTVRNLVAPLADPGIGAVAGNARVADRGRLISRWQHIEYVIGFNIDRRVQDRWGAMTTVPGAVGAFRRSALEDVGGVSADTLAEDTDLTIAIARAGWRVVYEPRARAWTEAPATFGQLWRQRYRWSYGTMQSLWKHRHAVIERGRSGHVGRVGLLPTAVFQVLLPLLAPMADMYLVYGLLFLDPVTTAAAWGVVLSLQLAAGVVAFRLEGEPLRALVLLPLQQVVYRQLMYAVLIQSVASAMSGARLGWQKIPRIGAFAAAPIGSGTSVAGVGSGRTS